MNIRATLAADPPRFLMCPPRHFAVTYSINPWMDPQAWASVMTRPIMDSKRRRQNSGSGVHEQ